MLFAIAALNYGDRTAISSVFPLLRADLGLSDLVLAGVGSVFLWSYAIGSPIAGYLADRLSRSRIVLFSVVAWSAVMLATGFVHSAGVLLFTRVLLGLSECAYLPASIALIADHHEADTRGLAMGIQIAGINIGLVGGSAVAGYIGDHYSWRMDFFVLGGAGLLLAFAASFILCDGPRKKLAGQTLSGWSDVRRLLGLPAYVAILLEAMLISIGSWIFLNWLPLYFHDRFRMSLAGAGLSSSSTLQVAAILGSLGGGFISDRVALRWPRRRFLVLAICYLSAAPMLLTFWWDARLAVVSASIFGYSFLRNLGAASESPIICELAGDGMRSTGIGILNTMNCFAGGVGVLGAGLLKYEYGLGAAFASVSATVALAGLVVLAAYFLLVHQDRLVRTPSKVLEKGMVAVESSLAPPASTRP
jgi:MFS family permease